MRCVIRRLLSGINLTLAQPNRYNIRAYFEELKRDLGRHEHLRRIGNYLSVTFCSHHPDAQLPDPGLPALHAVCARIAHMYDAAMAIDELEYDVEETRILAFDGSSARLLDHLMTPFAEIPGAV